MTSTPLPVPVLDHPHWRVNYRPQEFREDLLPTLEACNELVAATKLSLRGWDFPHIGRKPGQFQVGNGWIGSATNSLGNIEYWRFYQSGQFIFLKAVREAVIAEWKGRLRDAARSHGEWRTDVDWEQVPGYFSLLNFLYTVTEVFEFAARIAQRGVYSGLLTITIELKGIRGFVLTPELDRAWSDVRAATENDLGKSWNVDSRDLVADSAGQARVAVGWFFERFGWLNPNLEALRKDQAKFLRGEW